MHRRGLILGAVLLAACDGEGRIPAVAGPPEVPDFAAVWRISTHNSYWVDRGVAGDLFASGTGERILDQLLLDHARGIEIDIHKDPATPGGFAVYHTTPGNTLCDSLPGCLAMLRAFHRAMPRHEAVHISLELKEITESLFDDAHTIADLDRVLTEALGDLLYRPADLMARCPGATTLSACVRDGGWPSTHALRGRFVVSILGNWSGLPGAQATKDFVDYATRGDLRERAAFPMASSWQLDHEALTGLIYDLVTQEDLDRAFAQSAFLQVEDTADPRAAPFLAQRGVVRIDGAFGVGEQAARAALGMQLLQTDFPWIQADDRGAAEPLRALGEGFGDHVMKEPGSRLSLVLGPAGDRVFAYADEDAGDWAWETTVSSGASTSRVGCLRAAAALGSDDRSVTVCRTKVDAPKGMDAERVIVRVTACDGGACTTDEYPSLDPAALGPGDLLRIEVSNPPSGPSCVKARSATAVEADLSPRWADLGAPVCFAGPLFYGGIASPGAAWFFGTRRERAGAVTEVRGADFAGVVIEGDGQVRDGSALLGDTSSL
ncbi:MAG: Ca2+-dependent phosphoinositide-specific phospholipase C [Minicystis sp.]